MIDLAIVGGGPAGLATAIEATQAGLEVVVFEPRPGPIDKACGEGLMPPACRALERLGVSLQPAHPFEGIRFVAGKTTASARFSSGPGLGVRRTVLHQALLDRCASLNITIRSERAALPTVTEDHVEVGGTRARYLVAADGLASPLRRHLGMQLPARRPARLGLRRHYNAAPWSNFVEVHWAPGVEAYITPVDPQTVGVALLFYKDAAPGGPAIERFRLLLARFPDLERRLQDPMDPPLGAGPFEQRVSCRTIGRVLLVGDAAGFLDPLTGEGIRLALDAAQDAVRCILSNRVEDYDRTWRRMTRPYWTLTSLLLSVAALPFTRRALVPFLAWFPGLMSMGIAWLTRESPRPPHHPTHH